MKVTSPPGNDAGIPYSHHSRDLRVAKQMDPWWSSLKSPLCRPLGSLRRCVHLHAKRVAGPQCPEQNSVWTLSHWRRPPGEGDTTGSLGRTPEAQSRKVVLEKKVLGEEQAVG